MPHPLSTSGPQAASRRSAAVVLLIYLWTLPTTSLGLIFIPLAVVGGGMQVVAGVLELYGGGVHGFLRYCTLLPGGASAMTLGHVVLGRDRAALDASRVHERVHVRQCERWGPFFLPAYLMASIIAWFRGRDPYRGNAFEMEAYENEESPVE